MSSKVLDIDLAHGPQDIQGLGSYKDAFVLLRWRGTPLGQLWLDVVDGQIDGMELWRAASQSLGFVLVAAVLDNLLPLAEAGGALATAPTPTCSVIICTRDRPDDLARCIASVLAAAGPAVEIIVVDNMPSDDRTERLVRSTRARYVCELRKGLNWARSHGARVARGELVLYTDDDVVVDSSWIAAMCQPFVDPSVAAVTGLVLPLELETEAQVLFERYGGFGRGFRRQEWTAMSIPPVAAANVGAGASMAFRRQLVVECGLFDVELDAGTAALTAGDTFAFYQLLRRGHRIVYSPQAVVWHRHRRSLSELQVTLRGYSVGTYVFLLRCLLYDRELQALAVAWHWLVFYHVRQLWLALRCRHGAKPLVLAWAELRGCCAAPWAYYASRRREGRYNGVPRAVVDVDL